MTSTEGGNGLTNPPALPENGEGYDEWKKLVKMWGKFTKFAKKEQASVLTVKALKGEARSTALSMPEEELEADDGLDKLIKELDKLYLKDKDMLGYESWKKISKYKRQANSSILSYCAEYRRIRTEAKKYDIVVSDTTFSFMLLDNSGFSEREKMLILSIALAKSDDNKMCPDHIEGAMRRIQSSEGSAATSSSEIFETYDDFDYPENIESFSLSETEQKEIIEHAMYTMQSKRQPNINNNWRGGKQSFSQRFSNKSASGPNKRFQSNQQGPVVNPRDVQTGEIMRCHGCNSRFHLYRSMQCPNNAKAMLAEKEESEDTLNVETIYASERDFRSNTNTTNGSGVVDSAATKTVCGEPWFEAFRNYLKSLGKEITTSPSDVVYKFGNDGHKKSLFSAVIPVRLFGKNAKLRVDVIASNCPLLMGRPTLEKIGLILNFKDSTATVDGNKYSLQRSEKGHFLVSLMFNNTNHIIPVEKEDEILCAIDEVNEIFFMEDEIEQACEVAYSIDINTSEEITNCDPVMTNENQETGKSVAHKASQKMDVNVTARKLHLVFGHPTSKRLIETIQHAYKDRKEIKDLCQAVEKFTNTCETCLSMAKHKPKPKVCLPLARVFNDVLAFDLTFWNDSMVKKTIIILHCIDLATRLSAACVVQSKEPRIIINSLVKSWLNVFGAPKKVYTDNGGEFANKKLVELIENMGIEFKATAAESSFSNGINERHHAIIKNILDKIRGDHNETPVDIILSYAVFAKNCLVDNLGFSPHQRVFGRSPHIPTIMSENVCSTNTKLESDEMRNHLTLLHKTRQAYMSAESDDRIKRALKSRIYTSDAPFYYGEQVFYWRESQDKAIQGWKGPGTVVGSEGKVVVIRHGSFVQRMHETKVRRSAEGCALSKEANKSVTDEKEIQMSSLPLSDSDETDDQSYRITDENSNKHIDLPQIIVTPIRQQTETASADATSENTVHDGSDIIRENTNLKETDPSANELKESEGQKTVEPTTRTLRPRENIKPAPKYGFDEAFEMSDSFEEAFEVDEAKEMAKIKELHNFKVHEVYKEVNIEEATTPLITTRWTFSEKEDNDKNMYVKARLVMRGFQDIDKDKVASESPTAHVESLKVMLSILPTMGYRPKKIDISTAFLQGKTLCRPVFVKPPPEAKIAEGKCWMLLKGAYGLTDASRMWYERVDEVLIHGKYERSVVDPALYFKTDKETVIAVVLFHVDDFLYTGIESEILAFEELIRSNFIIRGIEKDAFMFCGFQVEVIENGPDGEFYIQFSQPEKISSIKTIKIMYPGDPEAFANAQELSDFRSVLGALQWHSSSTRPDITFSVSKLLGETKSLQVKHCIQANKLLRKAKANDPIKIVCKKLEGPLMMDVYSDASFGNLPNGGSQRGTITFIKDSEGRRNIVEFKSKRIKRVCRSTFAAELLACNGSLDLALYYKAMFKCFGFDLSVTMITDSRSVKDNLSSIVSRCEERSLRMELAFLREVLSKEDIKIKWVCSAEQLADVLTKEKPGLEILNQISNVEL